MTPVVPADQRCRARRGERGWTWASAASLPAALLLASSVAAAPLQPRRRPVPLHRYAEAAKRWHATTESEKPALDAGGRPMLVLHALNTDERIALPAASDDGGFDALSLDRAAHLLRDQRTGKEHPVYPPVLDLLYRAQRTFSAPLVRIVSGYRAPRPTGRGTSNHGRGRATDIVVPGVADETLAEWARGQGFVGVGIYPVGKFCHLDVRPQSYFWRDTSGPGQRSRETRLRGGGASAADLKSHKAGQSAFPAHAEPAKQVDAAWRKTPTPLPPVVSPEPEGPEDH